MTPTNKLIKENRQKFIEAIKEVPFASFDVKKSDLQMVITGDVSSSIFSYCDKAVFSVFKVGNEHEVKWHIEPDEIKNMYDILFDEEYETKYELLMSNEGSMNIH